MPVIRILCFGTVKYGQSLLNIIMDMIRAHVFWEGPDGQTPTIGEFRGGGAWTPDDAYPAFDAGNNVHPDFLIYHLLWLWEVYHPYVGETMDNILFDAWLHHLDEQLPAGKSLAPSLLLSFSPMNFSKAVKSWTELSAVFWC